VVATLVLIPICLFTSPTWVDAFTLTIVTAIILLSFVVVTGYAGQLSLAQFALAGAGGLVAALCSGSLGLPFLLSLVIAVLVAVPLGVIVGLPALKTRGVTLAVVTLGLAVALDSMIFENGSIAATYEGGVKIHPPTLFGWDVNAIAHPQRYLVLCVVAFILCGFMVVNLRRSSVGRRLLAVRANERASSALGIGVAGAKLYAFGVGSSLAAVGGTLLVFQLPPLALFTGFDPVSSIQMVSESVVGGVGYVIGPLLGGTMQSGSVGSQALDTVTGGSASANNWLYLISGVLLLAVLLQARDGMARLNTELVVGVVRRLRARSKRPPAPVRSLPYTEAAKVTPRSLVIRDLSVRFGGVVALNGVSIAVHPGEIVGLIGPNGAGKTTLLDAVCGFVSPSSGTAELDDEEIGKWSTARRANSGIGRSFQSLELFEDMTVYENLQIGAEPVARMAYVTNLFWPAKVVPSPAMAAACHEFRLAKVLDRLPSELPYGQRRLIAIARAVTAQPSIVLLDEPAAGLDEQERQELRTLVRRLATEWGMGVLIIEHDVELMMTLCDRITVLNFGEVVEHGTPSQVRASQAVIEAYLGSEKDDVSIGPVSETRPPRVTTVNGARVSGELGRNPVHGALLDNSDGSSDLSVGG
jgi:sulfate-transporting ATPase